jgi:hypothetical protein
MEHPAFGLRADNRGLRRAFRRRATPACRVLRQRTMPPGRPPGPGATFVAARYAGRGLSRGVWRSEQNRRGPLTIVPSLKPEYPPHINEIRGVAQGLTSNPTCKARTSVGLDSAGRWIKILDRGGRHRSWEAVE